MKLGQRKRLGIAVAAACFLVGLFDSCSSVYARQADLERAVAARSDSISGEMIEIRRDIHRYPELAGNEVRTARLIADRLKSYGLEVRAGIGGHGVVGILHGSRKGPVVAYRADMDALPQDIQEDAPFKSTIPGMGHACGHDVHVAVALGVAKVLSSIKDRLPGTVVFIFQPSEENVEGAKKMIAEGVLNDPKPEAIFAVHVAPTPAGTIAVTPGVGLPGKEDFVIRLKRPQDLAGFVQEMVSNINSSISTVRAPRDLAGWQYFLDALTEEESGISTFVWAMAWPAGSGGGEATIRGFIKASGKDEYAKAKDGIRAKLGALEKQGVTHTFECTRSLPDMFCNQELGQWAVGPLGDVLGRQSVLRVYSSLPFMGEDFAYYIQEIPGMMFWLGGSDDSKGIVALPNAPIFGVDERAILTGIKGMSNVLVQYLVKPPRG